MIASADPAVAGGFAPRPTVLARAGRRLTTTPGRMRLAVVAIAVGLLLLAVVGSGAVQARQRAANAVGQQAEPLLVGAGTIYTSLADADATATNTFLTPGVEPPARRQAYLDDLSTATTQLAAVARQAGTSTAAAQALSVITRNLPTYSGDVEAARANNRLGYPVGAAFLREGSNLMQNEILPNVRTLDQIEAQRLNSSYNSGRSALDVLAVVALALLALGVLVVSQVFLARRTNRLLNPALVIATVVIFALVAWTLLAFSASARRLQAARAHGSDPVQLLSSTQILLSRAQADENLALVARGSGSQDLADFDAVVAELGKAPSGSGGLIDEASSAALPPGIPIGLYTNYLKAHDAVVNDANNGQFTQAVAVATGTAKDQNELVAAAQLSAAINHGIGQAQGAFAAKAAAARHDLALLAVAVIGLIVVAGGLAVFGVEQRINEYR